MIKPGFSEATSNLIARMARANLSQEDFDFERAISALREAYAVADARFPETGIVIGDPDCDDLWDLTDEHGGFNPSSVASGILGMLRVDYFSAQAVEEAWQAWMAGPARAARAAFVYPTQFAIDYDFDMFVLCNEHWQQTGMMTVSERDALDLFECLLKAREAGLGWLAEVNDELYLIPAPKVALDDMSELHSTSGPAITYHSGREEYLLHGAAFIPELWKKIVEKKITLEEMSAIRDEYSLAVAMRMVAEG